MLRFISSTEIDYNSKLTKKVLIAKENWILKKNTEFHEKLKSNQKKNKYIEKEERKSGCKLHAISLLLFR